MGETIEGGKEMRSPILVDDLAEARDTQTEIHGMWYAAKPTQYHGLHDLAERVWHAWLVLIGKAQAFQYAEDGGICWICGSRNKVKRDKDEYVCQRCDRAASFLSRQVERSADRRVVDRMNKVAGC